jgi:hypothetical protein
VGVIETLSVTLEPGVVLPELRESETCCASSGFDIKALRPMMIARQIKPFVVKRGGRGHRSDSGNLDMKILR